MGNIYSGIDYALNVPESIYRTLLTLEMLLKIRISRCESDPLENEETKKEIKEFEDNLKGIQEIIGIVKDELINMGKTEEEIQDYISNSNKLTKEEADQVLSKLSNSQKELIENNLRKNTCYIVDANDRQKIVDKIHKLGIGCVPVDLNDLEHSIIIADKGYEKQLATLGLQEGINKKREMNEDAGLYPKNYFLNELMNVKRTNIKQKNILSMEGISVQDIGELKDRVLTAGVLVGYENTVDEKTGEKLYNIYFNATDSTKVMSILSQVEIEAQSNLKVNISKLQHEYDMQLEENLQAAVRMAEMTNEEIYVLSETSDKYMVISPDNIELYSGFEDTPDKKITVKDLKSKTKNPTINDKILYATKLAAQLTSVKITTDKKEFKRYSTDKEYRKEQKKKWPHSRIAINESDKTLLKSYAKSVNQYKFISELLNSRLTNERASKVAFIDELSAGQTSMGRTKQLTSELLSDINKLAKSQYNVVRLKAQNEVSQKNGGAGIARQDIQDAHDLYAEQKNDFITKYDLEPQEIKSFFDKFEDLNSTGLHNLSTNIDKIDEKLNTLLVKDVVTLEDEINKSEQAQARADEELKNEIEETR